MLDHRIGGGNQGFQLLVREARFFISRLGKVEYHRQDHAAASHNGPLEQIVGFHILGFCEKHVEDDHLGAVFRKAVHHPAPDRTGPGEAPELVDALLVNGGDHGLGPRGNGTTRQKPHVERFLLQDFEKSEIPQVHDRKGKGHDQCYGDASPFSRSQFHIISRYGIAGFRLRLLQLMVLFRNPR